MYITGYLICQGLSEQRPVLPERAFFGVRFLKKSNGIFNTAFVQSNFKSFFSKVNHHIFFHERV